MNKEFLNRVIKQVTSETRMDFTRGRVYTFFLPFFLFHPILFLLPHPLFSEHCKNVYGVNNEEIDYVWKEYKDKMNNKELV